ncbi:MAG: hypothetical protein MJE77_13380 [Proteobacteria bacterium]|nr:hypothetical protein [Pseudomonadota bacterium]
MIANKRKRSILNSFFVAATLAFFLTSCDGCIQLTGCNISLLDEIGVDSSKADQRSIERMIRDLGK